MVSLQSFPVNRVVSTSHQRACTWMMVKRSSRVEDISIEAGNAQIIKRAESDRGRVVKGLFIQMAKESSTRYVSIHLMLL